MHQFIGIIVVIVIGVAVVAPVIQSIVSDAQKSGALPESMGTILTILPIFVVLAIILVVVGLFNFGGRDRDLNDEISAPIDGVIAGHVAYNGPEPVEEKKKEPEPENPLEPVVPKKYKKPGRSYRQIRADMLLDEKGKKK